MLKDKSAIIITATAENSPANDAGLKPGDVVLSADGITITGDKKIQDFINFLRNKTLNSTAEIIVTDKNGTMKSLTINFDKKKHQNFLFGQMSQKIMYHFF